MEPEPSVLDSLRAAVAALPDDVPLRIHLATLLLQAGQRDEAVRHLGAVLQRDPGNAAALSLLTAPLTEGSFPLSPPSPDQPRAGSPGRQRPADDLAATAPFEAAPRDEEPLPGAPSREGLPEAGDPHAAAPDHAADPASFDTSSFDWSQAEDDLRDVLPRMFVDDGEDGSASAGIDEATAYSPEQAGLTLADVAGMTEVKARLEAAFLAPMRNPDLRKLYHKSLRGGLLLYGPPGCGKTFVARAVAGELGAQFITVSFADLIDRYVGASERNIHQLFEAARRHAPCVLFLDEVDAIGQKRSQLRNTPMRSAVNQLLLELDDVASNNTGVFLLAATNHPWDVDSALRRPGRFDRTLLVLPPDGPAREGVFRYHLRDRPVAGVSLGKLAKLTDGYSGADIAHVCETAAERALLDSVRTGEPRLIGQADLEAAIAEVRPSLGTWFDTARNVALFANEGGAYDDLAAYLRKRKLI
jgi:AAA+ superfamily predicted ATPase